MNNNFKKQTQTTQKKPDNPKHNDTRFTIKKDNFFLSSPKYILAASFVQIFMIIFATWFTLLESSTEITSTKPGSHDSNGVHLHVTSNLVSIIGLAVVTILFIVSGLFIRWSDPITVDHVVFILAIWILLGFVFKYACICCTLPSAQTTTATIATATTNDTAPYDISMGTAAPPDVFVIEWEGTVLFSLDSMCSTVAAILVYVFDSVMVALVVMMYVVVYRDQSIFGYIHRGENASKWTSRKESVIKIISVFLFGMIIFIPFACNNASLLSKESFFWKITLFSIVWLLRKTNSYNKSYFMGLVLGICAYKVNKHSTVVDGSYKVDIYKPYYIYQQRQLDKDFVYARNHDHHKNVFVDAATITKTRRSIHESKWLDNAVDWAVSSLVLFVCGWFTIAAVAQIAFEFTMFTLNTKHYNTIISGFQYELKEMGSAIIFV